MSTKTETKVLFPRIELTEDEYILLSAWKEKHGFLSVEAVLEQFVQSRLDMDVELLRSGGEWKNIIKSYKDNHGTSK